jgi:hypothetical protein
MCCFLTTSIRIRRLVVFTRDQPLIDYFKNYRTQHGLLQRAGPNQSRSTLGARREQRYDTKKAQSVQWEEAIINAGPAKLRFFRTLRVPDNADKYLLPPVGIV